jgi:hypothetical protein
VAKEFDHAVQRLNGDIVKVVLFIDAAFEDDAVPVGIPS